MSVSIGRSRSGDRFYCPPHVRRLQLQHQQDDPKLKSRLSESNDNGASALSLPSSSVQSGTEGGSNFDRFLVHTTPVVPAQYFSKTNMREWRTRECELHPYFVLGDLWESFREWSAYGAGVPLLLDGSDSVVQYYVPFLSGIQLYADPSRPSSSNRKHGEHSDSESSKESSSGASSECETERPSNGILLGAWHGSKRFSHQNKPFASPPNKAEISNQSMLVFEYFERDAPYSREPLADKISVLASQFPELKTYRSCDLLNTSWISIAWYPIYRIPTGPTLQNLDACFLTFHSLSTPFRSKTSASLKSSNLRRIRGTGVSLKLSLPIFGLASYKFKVSVWNAGEDHECQEASALLRAADDWLRLLQVDLPDFSFFASHGSYWR